MALESKINPTFSANDLSIVANLQLVLVFSIVYVTSYTAKVFAKMNNINRFLKFQIVNI